MIKSASLAQFTIEPAKSPYRVNPLVTRQQGYINLSAEEIGALEQLCRKRRSLDANSTLIHEGARLATVFVILEGVAFRSKMLASGRRQILGYLLPGEICDPDFLISCRSDYSVTLLTDAEVAVVAVSELASCIAMYPSISQSLALARQREGSIMRDLLLNLGRRHALQRIAHFLCEMSEQLVQGHTTFGGSLPMPLSQHELADTVGLTVVHVNRCLQKLRDEGVIALGRKCVTILDRERLLRIARSEGPCTALERPVRSQTEWGFARGGASQSGGLMRAGAVTRVS